MDMQTQELTMEKWYKKESFYVNILKGNKCKLKGDEKLVAYSRREIMKPISEAPASYEELITACKHLRLVLSF
jgi:hypothetical protein